MKSTRAAVLACMLIAVPRAAFADEPETTAEPPPVPEPVHEPTLRSSSGRRSSIGSDETIHKPTASDGAIYERAAELDATIRDAVQDLGYSLDVADVGPASGRARDLYMIERAQRPGKRIADHEAPGPFVVSARLEPASGSTLILRIVVVAPNSKQVRMRDERASAADLSVRGLVMLRDLLSTAPAAAIDVTPKPQESSATGIMSPSHSPGRAVLAANSALFGTFMAYSVQKASGSSDPRLLYPLLLLGAGVGLGAALLVAEEFNVTTGDAWTIAGGAWFGTAAGIFIANGRHVTFTDRYAWGVGGGIIGLSLATFSLTRHKADESDAVVVNSGAGFGLGLGALAEFFYRGSLDKTPYTGAGYGAAVGLLAGGTVATFAHVPSSRMLLSDLGAGLGAAAGAAIGSPLVFQNVTEGKTRGFVGATFGGTLAGGAIAWWVTRDHHEAKAPPKAAAYRILPYGGTIGSSETARGAVPAYGIGVHGTF